MTLQEKLERLLARGVSVSLTPVDDEVAVALHARRTRRAAHASATKLEDALDLARLQIEGHW